MTLIAPSLLASNFLSLKEEILSIESAGADWVHVDIMDGHFVPNLTFGPELVKQIRPITTLPLDVHLMVANPEKWIEPFAKSGADSLTIHPEANGSCLSLLKKIKKLGIKAAVALNPETPASILEPFLDHIDMILIMTVNPGFGRQTFINTQIKKIHLVSKMIKEYPKNILLEVDGGITNITAPDVLNAGATVLVAGSYIFKEGPSTYAQKIASLKI